MTLLARTLVLGLALLAAAAAHATSFTFATLPASGALNGAAGDTLGFGYVVANPSATDWLVITSLDAGTFIDGTPDATLFDFPVLAPGASLSVAFIAGTSGLFAFTWELAAPLGASNSGDFILGAEWWSGDPGAGGSFLSLATPASATYQVTVVPEPSAALLVATSLALASCAGRGALTKRSRSHGPRRVTVRRGWQRLLVRMRRLR